MSFVSVPNTGESLGSTRDQIRTNMDDLRSGLAVDHVDINAASRGTHNQCTFNRLAADPAVAGTQVALYGKVAGGQGTQLFFENSAGTVRQLTGAASSSAAGYTTWLGGIFVQWGAANVPSGNTTINLPISYVGGTFFSIQITPYLYTSDEGAVGVYVRDVSDSTFTVRNTRNTAFNIFWMTMGTLP